MGIINSTYNGLQRITVLLLLMMFSYLWAMALDPLKLKFRHLTEEDGLTNSHIYCIGQDSKGFIWIGTDDGLFRYDGHRFKHYINIPGDTSSLNSNVVFKLFTDSHNNLWIGTFMGLMRYDEKLDNFLDLHLSDNYRHDLPVPVDYITESPGGNIIISTSVGLLYIDMATWKQKFYNTGVKHDLYSGLPVRSYMVDRKGQHWLGTSLGVERVDYAQHTFKTYNFSNYSHKPFVSCFIHKIYEDRQGNIWVATRELGVFVKPAGKEEFINYDYQEDNKYSLGSDETYDIYEDKEGKIWISTNGGGLNFFEKETGRFIRLKNNPNDRNSLLNNNIRTIFEDRQGNLWITSYQAGINIHINHPQIFKHYQVSNKSNVEYQSSTVSSIFLDDQNKLWIGTDGGGLELLDRNTGNIKVFLPNKDKSGSFTDKVVMDIYKDKQGTLWFGTYQGGMLFLDKTTQKFVTLRYDPANPFSVSNDFVTCFLEDRKGNFWVGTNGGGLNLYDRNSGEFRSFQTDPSNPNSLVDNFINDLYEDHNGEIWIATFWGLSRWNTDNFTFTNYLNQKSDVKSLGHNTVFCVYEDANHQLWIGTRNGLNHYNFETNEFTYFSEKDGLAGNVINSIISDRQGFLWISTNKGISKFNTTTHKSVNFSEADGLQGNEFYRNSSHKGNNGELFFGGVNGFNSFFPDSIQPREYVPPVVITGLRIFEHDVPIGEFTDGRTILVKNITETDEITLKYSDKIFTLEVSGIDFIAPSSLVYAYKLEGFDANWNYTSAQFPFITYTNLSPGDYVLSIKAGNKNDIDKVDVYTKIKLRIVPPLWKTWWAYLIYMLGITFIGYYFWRLSLQRVKERNLIKLEKLKREKAEEINQAKLRFFTNISHEFRTPLTLIIGPLEQIISRSNNEVNPFRSQLDIMQKNARRMLRLVNQLLDFRKIEGGKMSLRAEFSDVVRFLQDIVQSFEEYAIEKRISFIFDYRVDNCYIWFDADKLDKIFFNLLSNSFKFTPEKGTIKVILETIIENDGQAYVKFTISDTGIGIPEKDQEYLFDRFYQANNRPSFNQGSGIGLSLTKNLVEIHHGKITFETTEGEGTSFHVYLPMGDDHLADNEKQVSDNPGLNKYIHLSPEGYSIYATDTGNHKPKILQNTATLLLVEDNIDLRNYIENEIKENYNFFAASNGREGYELAIEIMPDIIISDIMMPEMDGLQLCSKLKNNIITSHIPVLLLTAKSAAENQIEGYESGADAYIPKPFRIDQLLATINSLIENRIRLRERFNMGKIPALHSIKNTADDKFMQKAVDAVNNNIAEVDFGVSELGRELGISRVHLHRKLKAIGNISPNEFVRNIRLQKASELLLKQEFTVSEICYKVGFNSPAYFSSCFKSYYNVSPTEFIVKGGGF